MQSESDEEAFTLGIKTLVLARVGDGTERPATFSESPTSVALVEKPKSKRGRPRVRLEHKNSLLYVLIAAF